jgi:phosphoglycerate dehydrogenase-like enzyme
LKTTLLILDQQAEEYKKALEASFPEWAIRAAADEQAAEAFIEQAEILLTFRIADDLVQRASRLRWIQGLGTGVDWFLQLPSLGKDILITSTRGIHGPQMSEMALLLMLALSRDFPAVIRNQAKQAWERWPAELLWGKTAGILGLGTIGTEIAAKCQAFGMRVLGVDLVPKELGTVDCFYPAVDLLQAVREIDFLIIVTPLTSLTRKWVDEKTISAMKPTAFLINLARGEIVDEEALLRALQSGRIAGAALDVFSQEPLPKDHPLWKMKNVIITPHLGGTSTTYVEQALPIITENMRRYAEGKHETLINLIPKCIER